MEELVGPDHPECLRRLLAISNGEKKSDFVLRARALKVAQKYPNSYSLLKALYMAFGDDPMGYDADMKISLCLAMIRSNFLTSTSSQFLANVKPLCVALHQLGHSPEAGGILTPICAKDLKEKGLKTGESWPMEWLGEIYFETGHFEEAIKWYRVAFKRMERNNIRRKYKLGDAAIAAVLAGKIEIVDQILRDRRDELDELEVTPIIEAYRGVLAGKKVDENAIASLKFKDHSEWKNRQKAVFLAQIDLRNGTTKYRMPFAQHIVYRPLSRQMWAVFDGYERIAPTPAGTGFYNALDWLYPEDPWVKKAVADFRKRTPKELQMHVVSIENLMKALQPYPPEKYPKEKRNDQGYSVVFKYSYADYTYAIKRLLDKKDFKTAREMALRFNTLLSGFAFTNLRFLANHLIHKVEQAERAAKQQTPRPSSPEKVLPLPEMQCRN